MTAVRGDPALPWYERAACLGQDPELFFPVGNSGPSLVQIDEAKAVCGRCPVVEQCLRWALRTGQADGIWGGTTESERRAMRRPDAGESVEVHEPLGQEELALLTQRDRSGRSVRAPRPAAETRATDCA
jgi:WhiB family transcriptional regulator, redox-sensing transcriptional regulator